MLLSEIDLLKATQIVKATSNDGLFFSENPLTVPAAQEGHQTQDKKIPAQFEIKYTVPRSKLHCISRFVE